MNEHHDDADQEHDWFVEDEDVAKKSVKSQTKGERYRWWDSNPQSLA